MTSKILWAAIGGIITSVLIPITSYFVIRFLNKQGIKIEKDESEQDGYKVIKLILKNGAKSSLKNVIAHITVDNTKNDIITKKKNIFCINDKVKYALTSWAKNIDDKNYPNIDINQGECPDLNFIRYHNDNSTPYIEIASEQGFNGKLEDPYPKSRTTLHANRDYKIDITISGDNFFPIKKKYLLKSQTLQLIEL